MPLLKSVFNFKSQKNIINKSSAPREVHHIYKSNGLKIYVCHGEQTKLPSTELLSTVNSHTDEGDYEKLFTFND